jgi:hypothetical protein
LGKRLWEIGTWDSGEWKRLFFKVMKHELLIQEKGYGSSYKRQMGGVHRKQENKYEPLDMSA